jgi:hypothetical protein
MCAGDAACDGVSADCPDQPVITACSCLDSDNCCPKSCLPSEDIDCALQCPQPGGCTCSTLEDCADQNGDGLRDDPCLWYECACGGCLEVPRFSQADLGGLFGECSLDVACDGGDRFLALNCFSDVGFDGTPGAFPCEENPPYALNIDAGGPECCDLDGVCDGWDAFHTLNCFENDWFDGTIPYRCKCPEADPTCTADPWPGCSVPPACSGPQPQQQRPQASLVLSGSQRARPGDVVRIDVHLGSDVQALAGYQLHAGVRSAEKPGAGSSRGELQLADLAVDTARKDYVFNGVPGAWLAFNRNTAQLLVGLDFLEGVPAEAGAYLATLTYRIPADAAGTFIVDLWYGDRGLQAGGRTFMFGRHAGMIEVTAIAPARIEIEPVRNRAAASTRYTRRSG